MSDTLLMPMNTAPITSVAPSTAFMSALSSAVVR